MVKKFYKFSELQLVEYDIHCLMPPLGQFLLYKKNGTLLALLFSEYYFFNNWR